MNPVRPIRLPLLCLAAVAITLALAACGSSSTSSSSSSASAAAASGGTSATRTKFTACLKAHGVTLPSFHRPTGGYGYGYGYGGGGGFGGGGPGGAGSRFANPKFQAAIKACGGGAFAGRFGGGRRFAFNHAAVTKFAACVRSHGFNLPAPNFTGKGPVFPASIEKNAKFQTASKACASDLRPSGAGTPPSGAAPGATPTTSS